MLPACHSTPTPANLAYLSVHHNHFMVLITQNKKQTFYTFRFIHDIIRVSLPKTNGALY